MAGRFGAFAKLSRDENGGRPTDTWSCARCSQRNSPALKRCENDECRAVRGETRVDPGGVFGRRRADMGFDPNAGTRSRSGAAAWAGPNRAFPRDGGARVDPPRGPSRARVDGGVCNYLRAQSSRCLGSAHRSRNLRQTLSVSHIRCCLQVRVDDALRRTTRHARSPPRRDAATVTLRSRARDRFAPTCHGRGRGRGRRADGGKAQGGG